MASPTAPLPTFIIIGAQKSATRWLRINLDCHPEVYTAPVETRFFHSPELFDARGLEWYRAQFPGWTGEPIVGEATPGYMMWRHRPRRVAERIADVVPDVRLIALLRNPIDRAHSAMVHFERFGKLPPGSSLLELVSQKPPQHDPLGLVAGGWYAASLKRYQQLFRDQMLVLLHDDLARDPRRVYEEALLHIAAAPGYVPSDLETVLFSNQRPSAADSQRAPNGPGELSGEERQRLFAYFRDDVHMLEQMIGRDLSDWDPGGSYSVSLDIDLWKEPRHPRPRKQKIDVIDCYHRTSVWIEGLVRAVTPEQYGLATPCARWNVRDLLNTLVWLPYEWAALIRRAEPPDGHKRDFISDDTAAAYREAADHLLKAMKEPGRLEGTVASPFGETWAATAARLTFVNQLTHGWDLAAATGQDATIPASLLEAADQLVRGELSGIPRMPEFFDVEVPVSDEATPTERFAAFLGRQPDFEPARQLRA
jgi:uncharacterized protein (TIGR03086 family)